MGINKGDSIRRLFLFNSIKTEETAKMERMRIPLHSWQMQFITCMFFKINNRKKRKESPNHSVVSGSLQPHGL